MCFFHESDFPALEHWVNSCGMKSCYYCYPVNVIIKIYRRYYLDAYEDVSFRVFFPTACVGFFCEILVLEEKTVHAYQ